MTQHILFDLDNTLWDFDSNSHLAKVDMFHHFNLDTIFSSFDEFLSIYNTHNTHLWKEYAAGRTDKENVSVERFYLSMLDKGVDDYAKAKEMALFFLSNTSQRTTLKPNALSTLEYLSHKYQLHIITNGFVEVQYKKITLSGIGNYTQHVFISDEIGALKPAKHFFDVVIRRLNTSPDKCIIVGDSIESDIEGGINYNIKAIYYNPHNNTCPHNVTSISDLSELTLIL